MRRNLLLSLSILAACLSLAGCSGFDKELKANTTPAIAQNNAMEIKIKQLLKKMTVEEKAGQMVQLTVSMILDYENKCIDSAKINSFIRDYKIGSFLNVPFDMAQSREFTASLVSDIQKVSMQELGIPCIFGLDQIHGASYIKDASLFPQEINIAATFNPEYARIMGEAIGYETRAAMVPWTFSPVMDLARTALWPRNWESWGEDPYLQTVMSVAEVRAIQGDNPNAIDTLHCATSIKHYLGYGAPLTGKDRTPAYIPYSDLKEKYFPPFKGSVEAGAVNVMVNSSAINGIPTHANKTLVTGWLKEKMNWDGMVISDWADINNFYTRDHIATDKKNALEIGINAGIDMVMETYDPTAAKLIAELVNEGKISMQRLNDAVGRILRLKFRLGLFDKPTWDVSHYEGFGSEKFKKASYEAAVESEVLLKNENNILPLKKGTRILVTGPNANSMRTLNGGWTYTWQGTDDESYHSNYNTIYEAIVNKFGEENVRYIPGITYDKSFDWSSENVSDTRNALMTAYSSDVIIACIGENSYCETPGNISDLTLSENQLKYVEELAKMGKVILVLNEGRPRIINRIEPLASAVIDVMLPGNYGGDALADLLAGDANFSGKLPFTYPKYVNSIHTYDYKVSENISTMEGMYNYDAVMDVQWPFGAGLSYTEFIYGELTVDKTELNWKDTLEFKVTLSNNGNMEGKETVMLYSSDEVASMMPDVKRLRAFEKVALKPGEIKTVILKVPAADLAYVAEDGRWTLEKGSFLFSVGKSNFTRSTNTDTKVWNTFNK